MASDEAFIGRSAELAVLDQELDRVRSGRPRLVWLTGEAGIGKTSLLHRFVDRLSDVLPLWGSGDENEAELPYGVFSQLVAGLPSAASGRLAWSDDLRPDADPLAVGAALLGELGALQSSGPVVVVVDDAHWTDTRSAQALIFVLRRLRNDHVLVLLSARADAPAAAETWDRALAQTQLTRKLFLGGLSAEDLRRLSPAVDGEQLSPAASRRLHEHTGGHPLHARTLLEELPRAAFLDTTGVLPAPHSLSSLVLVRLAKVSPAAQALVLAVAVIGSRCALSDAVLVANVADPIAALDEAVRAGLLVESPAGHPRGVAFPHVLYRGAVYGDLSPSRRRGLHRRTAEVLGGTSALAHRVAAAVGPDGELADELAALAGEEQRQQNWPSAADHLLAAADLSTTAADRGERVIAAVAAMLAGGDIAGAARFEAAARSAPISAGRSLLLGQIAVFTGRFTVGREELTAALELSAGSGGTAQRAVASAYLSLAYFVEGDTRRAVELATEAIGADLDGDVTPLAGFVLVGGLASLGRQQEAVDLLDCFPAAHGSGLAPAQTQILRGLLALWSGQDEQAVAILGDVVRENPPDTVLTGQIEPLIGLAESLYRLGDWDGATTHAELALSLTQDAGVVIGEGTTYAAASYVAAGRGSWTTADSLVGVAVRAAQKLPWWGNRAYAASAQATLAQARGDHATMSAALSPMQDQALVSLLDGLGSLGWRCLLTESLLGLGRLDDAAAALHDLEDRVRAGSGSWAKSEAARLRAWLTELGDDAEQARTEYERAMALTQDSLAELSRARLETAYGRFLLTRGERRTALDVLRAAHDRLERLRAKPFLAICDQLLHSAGLRPPSRGDPLDLTSQELAVARLVAAGRTNSEAGLELFITSRTVAFHLTNIYAKTGITSRRELAARLPQLLP